MVGYRKGQKTLKKNFFGWIGLLLTLSVVLGTIGCTTGPKNAAGEYQVTGSAGVASASITYLLPTGVSASAISVALPWNYSFTGVQTEGNYQGTNVSLSAQNNSSAGSVTVTILDNNNIYQTSWALWPQAAITIVGNF